MRVNGFAHYLTGIAILHNLLAPIAHAAGETDLYFYRTQKGDVLSRILQTVENCPLYGAHGSIKKTTELNQLQNSSGDQLKPNQKVLLSKVVLNPELIQITPEREIIFLPAAKEWAKTNCTNNAKAPIAVRKLASSVKSSAEKPEAPAPLQTLTSNPAPAATPTLGLTGSYFSIAPHVSYSGIFATDTSNGTKGRLKSGLNYGFGIAWHKAWSKSVESYIGFDWIHEQYEKPSNRDLIGGTQNLSSYQVGVTLSGDVFSWSLELSTSERVSLGALSTSVLELSRFNVLEMALLPEAKLIQNNEGFLALQGRVGVSPATSNATTTMNGGVNSFGGKLYFTENLTNSRLTGGLFVKTYNLSNSFVQQTHVDEGIELQWQINLGSGK